MACSRSRPVVEMIAGLMFIADLWIRLAAVVTMGLSTVLMLLFG